MCFLTLSLPPTLRQVQQEDQGHFSQEALAKEKAAAEAAHAQELAQIEADQQAAMAKMVAEYNAKIAEMENAVSASRNAEDMKAALEEERLMVPRSGLHVEGSR